MGEYFLFFVLISKENCLEFDRCCPFRYVKKGSSELGWVFWAAMIENITTFVCIICSYNKVLSLAYGCNS